VWSSLPTVERSKWAVMSAIVWVDLRSPNLSRSAGKPVIVKQSPAPFQ